MPDLHTLLTFSAIVLGLFLIPGPAVLLTIGRAASGGRRVGIATGLGVASGDLVHATFAALGLSAILLTSALAFQAVKYVGVAYLIYLGVRALLEKHGDLKITDVPRVGAAQAYRQGVLTEVLNPKTALFFLSFLPQFVQPAHGAVSAQLAVFGLLFAGMSAVYTTLIALVGGLFARWLSRFPEIGRFQGRVVGVIYLTLGLRLAFEDRP